MSASNRQSPSVTMSSPATSCSCRYTDRASTYCSRNRDSTIASRNERVPRFSVYQLGRGSEPVMVVGMIFPAVAFSIGFLFRNRTWGRLQAAHHEVRLKADPTYLSSRSGELAAHDVGAFGQRAELHLRHHARQ